MGGTKSPLAAAAEVAARAAAAAGSAAAVDAEAAGWLSLIHSSEAPNCCVGYSRDDGDGDEVAGAERRRETSLAS